MVGDTDQNLSKTLEKDHVEGTKPHVGRFKAVKKKSGDPHRQPLETGYSLKASCTK